MAKRRDDDALKRLRDMQLPLFTDDDIRRWADNRAAGREDRDDGMATALAHQPEWLDHAYYVLIQKARTGLPFTSEDVTDEAGLPTGVIATNANNAVGALFGLASKAGIIVRTGHRVQARNRSSHAHEILEWVGNEQPETW